MTQHHDPRVIIETLRLIVDAGNVIEIRALDAVVGNRWPGTLSGYFDDPDKLAQAVGTIKTAKGIYITLNPVNPDLLARKHNRIDKAEKGGLTQDSHILCRRWLLIDCDAQRLSGISASDTEHQEALDRAASVRDYLSGQAWPVPIVADSGNGGHLLYRIDLPADDGGLVERCLEALANRFDDEKIKVDTSVSNPGQLCKLYGTKAGKGDSIPSRPHRIATILTKPDKLKVVPTARLEALADQSQSTPSLGSSSSSRSSASAFDVQAFIDRHGLDATGPEPWNGSQGPGQRWVLKTDPVDGVHNDGSCYIVQHTSGAVSAGGHHNSSTWEWADLRAQYEPIRDEIERLADEAEPVKSTVDVVVVEDGWTQPAPLMAGKQCPEFPLDDAFPPGLAPIRDYVSAVAEALQVPVDLPAMLLLPVGAVALAQKFEIEVTPEWREPSAIWTLTLLKSGNRKSSTFSKMLRPVHEWEQEEAPRLGPLIAKQHEERKIDEKRLDVLRKDAGTSGDSADQARTEAIELAQKIDEEEILSVPQIVTSEPTTEAMGGLLVQNKERIIVASAEADSLDVMLGRYSKKSPNFGIWLVGHAGDHYRVDRLGRAPDHLKRPALSVGLTVQPEAVRELFSNRQARGRGVIARFLTIAPQSLLGRRKINPKPIPQHLSEHYHLTVHQLLSLPINKFPTYIQLSEPASRLFNEFQEKIEPELARGGHLGDCTDWGAKLCGAVLRIALVLHGLAELGNSAHCAHSAPMVSAETMEAALAWSPYLIDQERIVTGMLGCDPAANTADRVLRWLERTGLEQFSRRDAFTNNRCASVQKVEDIDPALDLLAELGYIRHPHEPDHRGPGRKASPRFDVNPVWREAVPDD